MEQSRILEPAPDAAALSVVVRAVRDSGGEVVDWEYRDACARVLDILRKPREEVLGHLASRVVPAGFERLHALWSRALARGQPVHDELTYERRYYVVSAFPLGRDSVACTAVDVTALRESEARYRLLADHVEDVIWVLDLALGRMTYVSPSITRLRGLSVEEAMAEPLDQSLTPESLGRVMELLSRVNEPGLPDRHVGIFDQPCRDGSVKHVEVTTTLVRNEQGQPAQVVGVSRDATARVASESHLKAIFDLTLAGIIVVRLADQRLIAVNDAWLRQIGWAREEVLGKTTRELGLYPRPEERERVYDALLSDGVLPPMEARLRRKSGEEALFLLTAGTAEVAGERCAIGTWHDITDLRRADEALRANEAHLRTILQTALDGLAVVDADGRFLEVNPAFSRVSGYSEEALRGLRLADLDCAGEDPGSTARMRRIARDGSDRFEARLRRSDGRVIDVELSVSFLDRGGERFVVGLRDVTEAKQAREVLERSEERFRVLTEMSADMLVLIDAEGHVLFASPSVTERLGWSAAEILGLHTSGLVHPEDVEKVNEQLQQLLQVSGIASKLSLRLRHKLGGFRVVECDARNLLHEPAVRAVVINARDVTERHRLEEQFRQAQKLESVGRLAGGIAHDFNNLLTVILSCADALKADLASGLPANVEDAEEIHAAAQRAADLTRQLLAFARKQVVALAPLDLNAVVRDSEKLLRRVLGEDVELRVVLQPGLWMVMADLGQIEQVIMNLAVNARDAMPDGGTLTVETRNVHEDRRDWVRVVVRDTGVGIPEDVREHLFEPFFTTKAPGKGTGLGLATVYGIVQQAEGQIRVESPLGGGAAFELSFPRTLRMAQGISELPIAERERGDETILLAEDDAPVRAIIVRALRRAGYRVLAAPNGSAALAMVAELSAKPDLLITDVVMPGMDGRALVEAARRDHPDLKVLFVSGYTHDIITQRGVSEIGELLAKPFTERALLRRVRAILDAG